jgi:hypothetical protein
MDELWKMDAKKKFRIKTRYGRNDMPEEYGLDTQAYLIEKDKFLNSRTKPR